MATDAERRLASRDLTLDLARVAAVLLVVVIHLLFMGVGRAADRALVIERTVEAQPWFAGATWVGDIVPLFIFPAVALIAAWALGVGAALVDTVAIGVGSPRWFLAAYVLVQAFAPLVISLHRRAPVATVVATTLLPPPSMPCACSRASSCLVCRTCCSSGWLCSS